MAIAIFRFLWLRMAIGFFKGAARSETRLWYCLPGPAILILGLALVLMRQSPMLALPLMIAGSGTMRVQASMVEQGNSNAFRNAGLLVAAWTLFLVVVQEWTWAPISGAIAVALFAMHQMHRKAGDPRSYASQVQAANAAARQQLGDQ